MRNYSFVKSFLTTEYSYVPYYIVLPYSIVIGLIFFNLNTLAPVMCL